MENEVANPEASVSFDMSAPDSDLTFEDKPSEKTGFGLKASDLAPGTSFVERECWNRVSIAYKNTDRPIITSGPTGSGKTFGWSRIAEVNGKTFVRVPLDDTTSIREILGHFEILKDGGVSTMKFFPGKLTKAISQPNMLILLDDMSGMSANKMFLCHQLLDSGRIYIKELGEDLVLQESSRIVGALNPHTGAYAGTHKLDASLINRFICEEIPQFNEAELLDILPDSKIKQKMVEFFLKVNKAIESQELDFEFSIRNISYITTLIDAGYTLSQALDAGLFNGIKLIADNDQKNTALNVAGSVFGTMLTKDAGHCDVD